MGKKTQEKADEAKKTNTPNETEMTPEEKAAAEAKFLERVRALSRCQKEEEYSGVPGDQRLFCRSAAE